MVAYHRFLRQAFSRELVPPAALWCMASDATAIWLRSVDKVLGRHVGDADTARSWLVRATQPALHRRYDALAAAHDFLPERSRDPRAPALMLSSLYPTPAARRIGFALDAVGGPPRGVGEKLRALRWLSRLSFRERWYETATHLGELLIVLTQELPVLGVSRTNAVLGRLCFDAGSRYAAQMKKALKLPDTPASAIEVLRMGEYIYRVNPEHHAGSDAATNTGFIEGSACPWYVRSGWRGEHCGIFGQFQNGISHAFGLKYRLVTTIPRHGGNTCRIELEPIQLRRKSAYSRP